MPCHTSIRVVVDGHNLEAQPLQEGHKPVKPRIRAREEDEHTVREACGANVRRKGGTFV